MKIEFLKQLESILDCDENIVFIGTTNLPWDLDIAFLRRFERKILIPPLNEKDRFLMIKDKMSKTKLEEEDFKYLSQKLEGRTGAEIINFT